MITAEDKRQWRAMCWDAVGYVPTTGTFPIHGVDGELITTSYGQQEVMDCEARLILLAGGVRGGKSNTVAMKSIEETLIPDGLMWIVGPDYEQGKPEFRYIREALTAMGVIQGKPSEPDRGPQHLETKWGFTVQTKSSDDLTSLASFAPNILLGVEMGQQPEGVFDKLVERALEHNAKVYMSGTFEGALSWYPKRWERWQGPNDEGGRSFSLPSWSNTVKFPGGRYDPKIVALENALNDPELFLERVAAVPYKPSGLVFRAFNPKENVKTLDFDPTLPVELAIDPGTRTYAVVAVQWKELPESAGMVKHWKSGQPVRKTEVRIVDEVYVQEAIAQEVIELVRLKPWFKYVKTGVVDIAGRQRSQGAKSQVQVWAEETGIALRANYVPVQESVATVRLRLRPDKEAKQPLLLFDRRLSDVVSGGRAHGTIAEMGLYRWRDWQEGMSEKVTPIDANNHALKAIGYWLYDKFGPVLERQKLGKTKIRSIY